MKHIFRAMRLTCIKRMIWLRTQLYSIIFKSFGRGSAVLGAITMLKPENISVGCNTTINAGCFLNARDEIVIGDHGHISPFVIINTGGLYYRKKIEEHPHFKKKVIIHNGVWIGSGAIINPGVEMGASSVVGAGSVVTKNIPSGVVAVGVLAKIIKDIPETV